jgi:hypothetical protein
VGLVVAVALKKPLVRLEHQGKAALVAEDLQTT